MIRLQDQRVALIGAGNMAEALIAGMLDARAIAADRLFATDVSAERLKHVERTYRVRVGGNNDEAVRWANIVILAVKPQAMASAFAKIKKTSWKATLLISVAAGVPLSRFTPYVGARAPMVRAMPNTPSMVLKGASALAFNQAVSEDQRTLAEEIFQASGSVVSVDESMMDAVTGLSGSGPAYVYMMIEALADGGVRMGLSRPVARTLAAQTVFGAAAMVVESGEHPSQLRDRVASPGGTTIAGIHALEQGGFRSTVMNAVEAATARSRELGAS